VYLIDEISKKDMTFSLNKLEMILFWAQPYYKRIKQQPLDLTVVFVTNLFVCCLAI